MNDVREIPKSPGYDTYSQPYIERYEVPPHEAAKSERMRALVGNRKFERCLDIGCGIGFMTRYFAHCGQIYGVDKDQGKINYIQKIIPTGHFAMLDLEKDFLFDAIRRLFGPDQFDLIILTDVLSYLTVETRKVVAKGIDQLLDAKGLLLVSDHAVKIPERLARRTMLEEAGLWLLLEEVFTNNTYWVFQIFSRWPPSTAVNENPDGSAISKENLQK